MNVKKSEDVTEDDGFKKSNEGTQGVAATRVSGHFSILNFIFQTKNFFIFFLSKKESI